MIGLVVVYCKNWRFSGKQVVLNRKRSQSRFVKAAQDEFFLARIRIDVADGKDPRNAGLKFLGIDLERPLFHLQAPFGNGPELRMQSKECEHMVRRQSHVVCPSGVCTSSPVNCFRRLFAEPTALPCKNCILPAATKSRMRATVAGRREIPRAGAPASTSAPFRKTPPSSPVPSRRRRRSRDPDRENRAADFTR